MPPARAKTVLKAMDPNTAMKSRHEFIQLLAALTVVFHSEIDRRVDGSCVRDFLINACKADKVEWYFNNLRFRSTLSMQDQEWLASGTSRNEQHHKVMNSHWRLTTCVSERMLQAQMKVWLTSDMVAKLATLEEKTTRKFRRTTVQAICATQTLSFSNEEWSLFVNSRVRPWVANARTGACSATHKRSAIAQEQQGIWDFINNKKERSKRSRSFQ